MGMIDLNHKLITLIVLAYYITIWIIEPLILWEGILKYNRALNDPNHLDFPKDLNKSKLITN